MLKSNNFCAYFLCAYAPDTICCLVWRSSLALLKWQRAFVHFLARIHAVYNFSFCKSNVVLCLKLASFVNSSQRFANIESINFLQSGYLTELNLLWDNIFEDVPCANLPGNFVGYFRQNMIKISVFAFSYEETEGLYIACGSFWTLNLFLYW